MNKPRSTIDHDGRPLVAVPEGAVDYSASIEATGVGGEIETISLRTDALEILTLHKTGIRWSDAGAIAADPRIEDTASHVLRRLLLERIPAELDETDMRLAVDRRVAEAARIGDRIWARDTWQVRPITVGGQRFTLFVHTLEGAAVGVADLGPIRIAMTGPSIPDDLTLQLTTSDLLRYPQEAE